MVKFPFARPLLPPHAAWTPLLERPYAARWFSNFGPLSLALEERLAQRAARPVVACASATAGLTAALLALNRPGIVLLPAFTFPATLSAVLQAGLTPRLCDVDPGTWELSPATVAAAMRMGEPVAAVLAVRPFGLCRDLRPLAEFCSQRELPLIVDAAAALGGTLPSGEAPGRQGSMEVFSLHATKVFAVGEGGAIAADAHWLPRLRAALNFGLHEGELLGLGINGKMSEFEAAIGLAQDAQVDAHIALRQRCAAEYQRFFARYDVWGQAADPGNPPWQCYPVLAPDSGAATALVERAAARGVLLRRYYRPALHTVASYAAYAAGPLPVSTDLAARMVCLPLYSDMRPDEQGEILGHLEDALRGLGA